MRPGPTLSNSARASLSSPRLLVAGAGVCAVSPLGSYCWARNLWVLFIYLFFLLVLLPSEIPRFLHRPTGESVSWCLKTSVLRLPSWDGSLSLPLFSLFIFYILSYLLLKTLGCLSGCLMSSASIQKLFCGICSAFKCSFNEFVGEKVVSPSYSSAILGPPPLIFLKRVVVFPILLCFSISLH